MTALRDTTTSATKVRFDGRQLAGTATATPELFGEPITWPHRSAAAAQAATSPFGRPAFQLTVLQEDGLWMVTDRPTGVYGCGDTVLEAVTDFRQAARQHLDVLQRQAALAGSLREQLEYLRARVS